MYLSSMLWMKLRAWSQYLAVGLSSYILCIEGPEPCLARHESDPAPGSLPGFVKWSLTTSEHPEDARCSMLTEDIQPYERGESGSKLRFATNFVTSFNVGISSPGCFGRPPHEGRSRVKQTNVSNRLTDICESFIDN